MFLDGVRFAVAFIMMITWIARSIFIFFSLISNLAFAQISCQQLFAEDISHDTALKLSKLGIILEEQRPRASLFKMSDLIVIRSNFEKFDKKIKKYEYFLDFFKSRTGSSVSRSRAEANSEALKIILKLRTTGLVDKIKSELANLFKRYEVAFNLAQELGQQIIYIDIQLKNKKISNSEKQILIRQKQKMESVLLTYNLKIGELHESYYAIRKKLIEETYSKNFIFSNYASELLLKLENSVSDHALAYPVEYKRFSLETAERYVAANVVAQSKYIKIKMQKEIILHAKMFFLNSLLINHFQNLVYKIPSQLSVLGFNVKEIVTELLGLGYSRTVKRIYLEPISEILEIENSADKYERLKSLNEQSVRSNELLQVLNQYIETQDVWNEIMIYAEAIKDQKPHETEFYEILKKIDQESVLVDKKSLFIEEAKVTTSVRVMMSIIILYKSLETLTGITLDSLSFMDMLKPVLETSHSSIQTITPWLDSGVEFIKNFLI